MKKFKYRWESQSAVFTGSRVCRDREDLETSIAQAGGKLLEILEEAEAPQEPSVQEPAVSAPAARVYTPEVPETTNLLHPSRANQEPDILIKIWAWFMMISGGIAAAVSLLGLFLAFFMSLPEAVHGKFGGISMVAVTLIGIIAGAVEFFLGMAVLSFPVIAAYFLLTGAVLNLLLGIWGVFLGNFSALAGMVIPGVLVWYILRKKKA